MSIFIDSSAFIAYYHIKDEHHKEAVELFEQIFDEHKFGEIYSSDYILGESVTVVQIRTKNKKLAIALGERLLYSEIKLLKITEEILEKTWELYKKVDTLSFTDCSTLALMQEYGIENIATFDKELKKAIKSKISK